ncbi:MAG: 3-hydroxybutyryl-CoA dehydrogenase [Dehalococcoidia bacterium]|nr:3-hydroxybutyryl-CoA dehydrogenase [Dehalococcoidia bacterium]
MEVKKVGIVGCGIMGGGIAQVAAQAGFQVVVSEVNDTLLKKGLNNIESNLRRNVEKGRMKPEEMAAVMGRIKGTLTMKDFGDCDLVIEAAVENMDIKKKIFAELEEVTPKHAVLASNTSSMSIIDMAMATKRPDKVLGIHFFNPVPVMRLVEIVRTIATSDETIAIGQNFARALGKTTVLAKDTAGFIVNRILSSLMATAVRMYESGVASKEDIDTAVQLGLNHPMGPLALADLVGIDTCVAIIDTLYNEFKEPQYIVPPTMRDMVTAGYLGRKTGKGFYDYTTK